MTFIDIIDNNIICFEKNKMTFFSPLTKKGRQIFAFWLKQIIFSKVSESEERLFEFENMGNLATPMRDGVSATSKKSYTNNSFKIHF